MTDSPPPVRRWRKSSASADGGCVEIYADERVVRVRDSKNPDGPELHVSRRGWSALLDVLKERSS
ncbi:DUF397 domain-containing protein [Actinomadura barringtoniae]|uniref:DUF397 domain-containing protein n=1 Tax=Actinomadura barringtoniae TaxID=1427535 RepID=A0A939T387_9ACTN|nr:DUF397 domain-containing protein [Actinomadura barringtoniae]MBO2450771.1 DUF397 domain-containing protein [Actinomadura barringtoniae]